MTQPANAIQIDTRLIQSNSRLSLVFRTFNQLGVNATMELLSDNDPEAMRGEFEMEKPNLFAWEYLESGPEVWRVAVTKLKGKHGVTSCCGACGG
jgi:uncharacterized protein (DUF2249 family)